MSQFQADFDSKLIFKFFFRSINQNMIIGKELNVSLKIQFVFTVSQDFLFQAISIQKFKAWTWTLNEILKKFYRVKLNKNADSQKV
ncbi:hypothetical protein BpHYR1_047586 [Brachionus plicatilis]|uniref:Uncharacterized protein n=1 Tax=Brachionus plicatilis TaxID=10195 RepID=A0A3M7SPZ1_BRAPC|nr:hypothetical protein BpHYR1_047586 [Brachionus plicatilis]